MQAQNHLTESGLTAARLTDNGEYHGLIAVYGQGHVVNSHELLAAQNAANAENLADAVYFQ